MGLIEGPIEGPGETLGSAEGSTLGEGDGDTAGPAMWSLPPLQVPGILLTLYQP